MRSEKRTRNGSWSSRQRKEKDPYKSRKKTSWRANGTSKKKPLELTQKRLKEIFHYNPKTGLFVSLRTRGGTRRKGDILKSNTQLGYIRISIDFKHYYAHRLAWLYMKGKMPRYDIDHRNHNTSDNRMCNLREGKARFNLQNLIKAKSQNQHGFLGVEFNKKTGVWSSRIKVLGKRIYIGTFATGEKAHQAYLSVKRKLHQFNTL